MTGPRVAAPTATRIRLIHFSLVMGVALFASVVYFLLRPGSSSAPSNLPPFVPGLLMGLSLGAFGLSIFLRRRIPHRRSDHSPDSFWATALSPALITWAVLQAAGLLDVIAYMLSGSRPAMGLAILAVILLAVVNPAYLERR